MHGCGSPLQTRLLLLSVSISFNLRQCVGYHGVNLPGYFYEDTDYL